ncbi:WV transmembrane phosphoprotein [Cotia virus SPAn232]|uniref:WV transmembrane phosphoprotein n=2 Tax=Cotia virus TaxID=39444 RepID=A0A097IW07_9POXV|nr:WV transmembrane phosphoprotein [Cotia virus SPAn232]AFB76946.1 WV transmembrane phosphoprotein [Cotia virus SPAn232]AIT70759.1 WV transmembrane phosphoprotein [Cotia virus]
METGIIIVIVITTIIAILLFCYSVCICIYYTVPLYYKKNKKKKIIKLNEIYFGTNDINKKSVEYITNYETDDIGNKSVDITSYDENDNYNKDEFIEENEYWEDDDISTSMSVAKYDEEIIEPIYANISNDDVINSYDKIDNNIKDLYAIINTDTNKNIENDDEIEDKKSSSNNHVNVSLHKESEPIYMIPPDAIN